MEKKATCKDFSLEELMQGRNTFKQESDYSKQDTQLSQKKDGSK